MPNQNAAGCQMSGGRPDAKEHRGHSGLIFLVVGMLSILGLSRRRPARFTLFTAAVLGFAGFSPTGCGNDSQDQNNNMMMGGNNMPHPELNPSDEIGRYQSAVSANNNVYISAYDTTMGDLAFTTVGFSAAPTAMLTWLPVDGLPTGNPMDTSSTAYRGGYTDPGPDVGRFTSLALTSAGLPVIAYQDVTNGAVKLAIQTSAGGQTMQGGQAMPTWQISTLTAPTEGKLPGSYISMVLDPSDTPTVAYMVQGVRKADSSMTSQLVVAHAGSASPTGSDGWQKTIVAEVPTSCAGLCGMNEACVYADPTKPSMVATICQTVDTSCTPSCKSGQACMAGKCVAAFGTPAEEEPLGTGLYANLVNAGANTVVFFHDSTVGALNMAQSPDWKVTTLAGGDGMTVAGKGIGAAAAPDGTLHVAYGNDQSQVQYLAISGGMPGTVEMVDDGTRMVNGLPEMHPVGGGLYLFIDGGQPAVAYQDQMAVTLETARRGDMTGWTHATLSMNNMQGRGFYPQAVSSNNQWLVLDVAYDRSANALSSVAFSPM